MRRRIAFGMRLKNFRKIFHGSNYLNGQINFGVGAWSALASCVFFFGVVCGVGCVVWLVLGGVRFFWYCNLNNISVLFKSPSGAF